MAIDDGSSGVLFLMCPSPQSITRPLLSLYYLRLPTCSPVLLLPFTGRISARAAILTRRRLVGERQRLTGGGV